MRQPSTLPFAILLAATQTAATAAASAGFPERLARYAEAGGLKPEQHEQLAAALASARGYGVCAGPLKPQLEAQAPHWLCEQLAGYVAYLLARKADTAAIERLLLKRQATQCGPRLPEVDLSQAPRKGAAQPRVTLVEFFDFQCWACQRLTGILDTVLARFKGEVALYHKQWPIKGHANADLAAAVALAAARQGQYWEVLNLLFVISPDHDLPNILKYAKELKGLDLARLQADASSPALRAQVVQDKKDGLRLGVKATPALFIDGRLYDLPDDEYILADVLTEALRRQQSAPDPSCQ